VDHKSERFPFEGDGYETTAWAPSPSPRLPLVRFCGSSESYVRPACGAIGFPASASSSLFPSGKAVFTERRPPILSHRFHPLMSFPPLQSAPSQASRAFRPGMPSLGFCSLFAASTESIIAVASQFHGSSVLGVSHVCDGFVCSSLCRFISPRNHVQGFPPGFGSPRTAGDVFRHPVPSCRSSRFPAGSCPPAPVLDPRLQGFAPCTRSWSANVF